MGIVYLIGILAAMCIVVFGFSAMSNYSDKKNSRYNGSHVYDLTPNTTTITKYSGATLYHDYGRSTRYIDGRPIATGEDMERWWVLKGFSDAIAGNLYQLEHSISSGKCADPSAIKDEWHNYYSKYRLLCIRHKLYNSLLGDKTPFIPTQAQLEKEKALYQKIEQGIITGNLIKQKLANEEKEYERRCSLVLQYINNQYRHVAIRHIMISDLCNGDVSEKYSWNKLCDRMVRDELITLSKNSDGKYVVRKKYKSRSSKPIELKEESSIVESVYSKEQYAQVPRKTLYKVEYTVGSPISIDIEKRTCSFVSQSSGTLYNTTLSECTCPAFDRKVGIPCKHMVALAIHLGYYRTR